jgi:phenylalanyl-tRNA synthetase alpha chain
MTSRESQDIFQSLRKDAFKALEEAVDFEAIRKIEADYLGKSGRLTRVLRGLKDLPEPERKEVGSTANALKKEIEEKIKIKKDETEKSRALKSEDDWFDISRPGKKIPRGHLHPISRVLKEVAAIFESMGFEIVEGPEAETEYYNFDALNIPKNHPARDLMDTFWLRPLKNHLLLRTHTSPMEARYMEKNNPPLRIIAPGKCFRREATDASHEHTFYQVEGLMVGKNISLSNLKGTLEQFMRRFYGEKVKLRWQPSFFPFVEPGLELLMGCSVCGGKGCSVCSGSGWLEVIPCGMTHPEVFKAAGYNPSEWQGFAFGMGLDRIAMMKYKIDDIRLFHSGDWRFIYAIFLRLAAVIFQQKIAGAGKIGRGFDHAFF